MSLSQAEYSQVQPKYEFSWQELAQATEKLQKYHTKLEESEGARSCPKRKKPPDQITADTMIAAAYRFHEDFPAIVRNMHKTHIEVKKNLKKAQERQQHYADKSREALILNENDQVMVKAEDYKGVLIGATRKLHPKYLGPYRILRKVNDNAFEVDIPDWWKRSKIINISKLKLYNHPE